MTTVGVPRAELPYDPFARYILQSDLPYFDVYQSYGGDPNSSDNTAAIQAAMAAANAAGGGRVMITKPFRCASNLDASAMVRVELMGLTPAANAVAGPSVLQFTGAAAAGIVGAGSSALSLANLYIYSSNAGWAGSLLNMDGSAVLPTSLLTIKNCTVGVNADTSGVLLALDDSIETVIDRNVFLGGVVQVRGLSTAGHFVNALQITRNAFQNYTTAAIKDPGSQAVTIAENTFEPGTGGIQKAVQTTIYNALAGARFAGNWIGDSTADTQTFVELSGTGIAIHGNFIASAASGNTNTGFRLRNVIGCDIRSNRIGVRPSIAFDFDGGAGGATSGVVIDANTIDSQIAVSSLTSAATTATVVTSAAHGLATGYNVVISGANETAYNGIYQITVVNATTFTYTFAGAASPATGTIIVYAAVVNFPSGANYRIGQNVHSDGTRAVQAYPQEYVGSGAPSLTAAIGSSYRRIDGGVGSSFYVKQSGSAGTGWVAVA